VPSIECVNAGTGGGVHKLGLHFTPLQVGSPHFTLSPAYV